MADIPEFDEAEAPEDSALKLVADLAQRQLDLEAAQLAAAAELKRVGDALRQVSEVDLPQAMTEVGLSEFKLVDGSAVAIETKTSASIPKARAAEAYAWLREHGHGDLIKRAVTVNFGRGEDELAAELLSFLSEELGEQPVKDAETVHAQTLGAFVRERLAEGDDLPGDLLGVFTLRRAVITRPKER